MNHRLPAKVFEANLPGVLGRLAALDATEEPLVLDFLSVEYWTPAAIVALCAMVNRWIEQGRRIAFENVEESPACSYLQRID
ncbi:MAG: STAS domain-containing protein, partial [Verrucomicrobiota bacterium]